MHIEKYRKIGWSRIGSIKPSWGAAMLRPYTILPSPIALRRTVNADEFKQRASDQSELPAAGG